MQHIGHHDRNALALRQLEHRLQVGGEIARQRIELAVANLRPHARVRCALGIGADTLPEQVAKRLKLAQIDFSGDPLFITLQPDLVQRTPPSEVVFFLQETASSLVATPTLCAKLRRY